MPSEKVEPFRLDRIEHLDVLARRAARWAQDAEAVRNADPKMPFGIYNRNADNLHPRLAIAEVAGGSRWPERARKAALAGREADDTDERHAWNS